MCQQQHGIYIGIEQTGQRDFVLTIKAIGTLTHDDYQAMVPMLESAIAGVVQPQIDCLMDISELDGWDARALWDDLKLGVQHGREFRKIAILGSSEWQQWMTKVADWFTPIDMEYFTERQDAVQWLQQAEL